MSARILMTILWIFCGINGASATGLKVLSGTPFDLLQRSIGTSSATERGIIRGYLARNHPETAEGLFSAAWIAGMDGRGADKVRLYEAAIETDPELTVAYINLALELSGSGRFDEARALYDRALLTAPFDTDLVRNGFFLRKEQLGDHEGAVRFLDEWQARVGNLDYAFDFVRGIDAAADGRLAEAGQYYEGAIAKGAPFEVYEKLAELRLKALPEGAAGSAERFAAVVDVMEPLMEDGGKLAADAHFYVGRLLRDLPNTTALGIRYMSKGFDLAPDAEKASEIFTALTGRNFGEARDFLEKAQTMMPDNHDVKNTLSWMHYQFLPEPERAGELALEAIELAPHDEARLKAILSFGASRQHYGRFDEAHRFYLDRLGHPWSTEFRNRLLMMITDNLIAAQRFDDAMKYLDALRVSTRGRSSWLDRKTALVEAARTLEMRRVAFGASPAETWHQGFDPETRPRVLFALNSDVIPVNAYGLLDKAARLLKTDESGALILSVEGYADKTGDAAANDALSLRRAEAVRDYLVREHGLAVEKLRVSAHGSRFPGASNRDREGRRQNRRVEIRALNVAGLAGEARANAGRGGAFSPDGRHAVFGQNPSSIWDVRASVRLHDLHRGRDHRFSPDGLYVSAISSYREEGGQSTEAVYIYDAASGNVVAQLHEPLEIVSLVWKPDSTAIAFATADGFLKLYDLESRGYSGVTRMGPVRIGGPLAWFADGSMVAGGQHRMDEIILWDARTLKQRRRLDGVNWPHALGVSPDGRHLVAFDNARKMTVWDRRANMAARQVDVPMIPLDLQFHPDNRRVFFNARFEASEVSVAALDYGRLSAVATWSDSGPYVIGLSPGGSTLVAAAGDKLIEFDSETLAIAHDDRLAFDPIGK